MAAGELEEDNAPQTELQTDHKAGSLPVGIARVRAEWEAAGLVGRAVKPEEPEVEPVLFTEIDGGAGIGDYVLECDSVRNQLALSQDAMDRLIASGELDSIVIQGPDGVKRRMVSESSVRRFEEDSAIDPEALRRAAKSMADRTLAESVQSLAAELEELRNTQGKVTQQMKDMLLLEIRNLKGQDRDLTSFVYELAEEIRRVLPKKRR
jgi:hypothetical protein